MKTAEHFQDTFIIGFDEALELAVLKRRFLIRDKLEDTTENAESSMNTCTSDSSMESTNNDSSNGKSIASE